jgi:hypothetical protein
MKGKKKIQKIKKQPKAIAKCIVNDRQPMLMVVCGETGVGKTYRTVQEIKQYVSDIAATKKKGRKVLIFDVNDDDYTRYITIDPNHVKDFKEVRIRRIRPITRTGRMMTLTQKREIVEKIVAEFTNGLIVLEDIDKFMVGAKGQEVVGVLCANRHSDLDILISHQSIAKITTTEWQNMTWLRLHKQVDDISRYRNRIPNYALVRIATFIVEEQYNLANDAFEKQQINEKQFQIRKSFFVYLDMRRLKIKGCSKAAFIRAAKRFIDQEENKKLKLLLQETTMDEKPKFKNRKSAVFELISQKMRYHQAA